MLWLRLHLLWSLCQRCSESGIGCLKGSITSCYISPLCVVLHVCVRRGPLMSSVFRFIRSMKTTITSDHAARINSWASNAYSRRRECALQNWQPWLWSVSANASEYTMWMSLVARMANIIHTLQYHVNLWRHIASLLVKETNYFFVDQPWSSRVGWSRAA